MAGRLLTTGWQCPRTLYDTIEHYKPHALLETCPSIDVGDVSWVVPAAKCVTAC